MRWKANSRGFPGFQRTFEAGFSARRIPGLLQPWRVRKRLMPVGQMRPCRMTKIDAVTTPNHRTRHQLDKLDKLRWTGILAISSASRTVQIQLTTAKTPPYSMNSKNTLYLRTDNNKKDGERGRVANRLQEEGGVWSGNPDWRVQRGDLIGQCEELSV